jgi:4-methyl-5(b-hydroxyethyl)-thiazole monophosphate biosynthesis
MKKRALIILAEGFEETEAIVPIDVLRRAGVEVIVAGLGSTSITGAHGITVQTDIVLEKLAELPDAVIFPGGMPGAENLAGSRKVKELILTMSAKGKIVAAICASPALVLAPLGILSGKKAACYPGMEKNFSPDIEYANERIIQDGNIITSKGPATAFSFALKIAENLVGKNTADMIGKQMLYSGEK